MTGIKMTDEMRAALLKPTFQRDKVGAFACHVRHCS